MAVTVSENVLLFTGTTTLDPKTFGPRLYAKALKWVATGATAGTSRARIDAASGGTTLWESVAEAANVNVYNAAASVPGGGLEFRASGTGGITVVVDVGTLYVYG
jgi:hypothetical protein